MCVCVCGHIYLTLCIPLCSEEAEVSKPSAKATPPAPKSAQPPQHTGGKKADKVRDINDCVLVSLGHLDDHVYLMGHQPASDVILI